MYFSFLISCCYFTCSWSKLINMRNYFVKDWLLCKNYNFLLFIYFCLNLIQQNSFYPFQLFSQHYFEMNYQIKQTIFLKIHLGSTDPVASLLRHTIMRIDRKFFLTNQVFSSVFYSKDMNIRKIHQKLNIEYIFKKY